jgi:iron complex outermembrane recepter protein
MALRHPLGACTDRSDRFRSLPRPVLAFCALAAAAAAQAQSAPPPSATERVVVTGNPLGSSEVAAPVSLLTGDALVLKRGSTLADTLDGLPGVSSTWFGPNANRPIVRGLDGDRVRILGNAGASIDASSLSFDHAVPLDPLIVERIEVLRGPGALLYGSAVGGVVNALDNRIPAQPLTGLSGAAELRLGGAADERGGAALIETGSGAFALHADVFGRHTSDLRVPRYTPLEGGEPLDPTERVRNSSSRTQGGALGGSWFFGPGQRSRAGLSVDRFDSTYGVVVEEDIRIEMLRDRLSLATELNDASSLLPRINAQFNRSLYEHREIEGSGEVGTVFASTGSELRIEAQHRPLGPWRGVIGLQREDVDFSALGEEAFVPGTRTRRDALFAVEELAWSGGSFSAGLRLERVRVASAGDGALDPGDEPQFGAAAERRFSLRSASLGHVMPLSAQWQLSGSLTLSERAPTSFELFADGVHAATGVYERGDPSLGKERGTNLDLGLAWRHGPSHWRLGVFSHRFSDFISLDTRGEEVEEPGEEGELESFPVYEFLPVSARLHGVEIDGRQRLLTRPWTLDLTAKLDLTRGRNADTGEALPRIAPMRLRLGLDGARGPWGARVEIDHAARQDRVPATDVATAGYTLVHLSVARRLGDGGALWFLRLDNATDRLATSASSLQTVRGLSPLPGRSIKTGVRVAF